MEMNQQKEQFSNAYIRAVAATSGFECYKPTPDVDSVDWGIAATGGKGTRRSPRIELQLKCTARDIKDDHVLNYPLPIKNYDDLRIENYMVPRILVVVLVPKNLADWLHHSEKELAMRHCGYWVSLRGMNMTTNQETVTVHVPRRQQFTVDSLREIMHRVGDGGLP
jgi:hypothetical protein